MRPTHFYKYREINQFSLKSLEQNNIFFPSRDKLNDPFDLQTDCEIYSVSNATLERYFMQNTRLKKDLILRFISSDLTEREFDAVGSKLITLLDNGQIMSISSKVLDLLWDAKMKELKYFFEKILMQSASKTVSKVVEEKVEPKGVFCVSEIVDDILMWSYYANGHQGFCIEYDASKFEKAIKVRYKKSFPKMRYEEVLEKPSLEVADILLGTKFKSWSHEKEWRILHMDSNFEYPLEQQTINGIYFGAKMSKEHKDVIRQKTESLHGLKFYQMELSKIKYKVRSHQINF